MVQAVGTLIKYCPLQVAHGYGGKCSAMHKCPLKSQCPWQPAVTTHPPQLPYGLLSTLVSLQATDCTVLLLQATAWALRALWGGQHSTPYLTKGVPTPPGHGPTEC